MNQQQAPNWSEQVEIVRRRSEAILRQRMRPLQPTCIAEDIICGDRLMAPTTAARLPWLPAPNVSARTIRIWFTRGLEFVEARMTEPSTGKCCQTHQWTTSGALKRFFGIRIPTVAESSVPSDGASHELFAAKAPCPLKPRKKRSRTKRSTVNEPSDVSRPCP